MTRDIPMRTGLGLLLLLLLSAAPLVLETRPVGPVLPYESVALGWAAKGAVLLLMGLAIVWFTFRRSRAALRLSPATETTQVVAGAAPQATGARPGLRSTSAPATAILLDVAWLVLLAGFMTYCHWALVNRNYVEFWQVPHFLKVLSFTAAQPTIEAPHPFRPLPYGFVRMLEWCTGNWMFADLAYRWFLNFWLLWASYRFARLFHTSARALLVVMAVPVLYPFSIQYYLGQPTDPMSHALFVLALIYTVEDRPAWLAAVLGLGVMAKETVVVVVPGFWACNWRKGWRAFFATVALGVVCMAAFLAVRLPLGWRLGNRTINGLDSLMVGTNLGIGEPIAITTVPFYESYLQPAVFVGSFLPFIALRWRRLDHRLRALFLTVTPLVVLSSLCFSWLYESRNYVPLLPLLATMALPPTADRKGDKGDGGA